MAEFSRELPFDYDPDSKVGDSTRSTVRARFTVPKLYKTFCIPLSIDHHLQQARAYFSKVDYYQTIFSLTSLKKILAFQYAVFYNPPGCDCWSSFCSSPRRQHECSWFLCMWPAWCSHQALYKLLEADCSLTTKHTHTQACVSNKSRSFESPLSQHITETNQAYTSLYDCTNTGGHSQYFCVSGG